VLGCKKESNKKTHAANELVGEWARLENITANNDKRTSDFRFYNDCTLIQYTYYLDAKNKITGYGCRGTSKYRIINDQLEVCDNVLYLQDPAIGYHSTESQLVLQLPTSTPPSAHSLGYFYKVEKNDLSLIINYPPKCFLLWRSNSIY
jgi:hypothetical protein